MKKLDKIDKKLLYELDLNARLPETILAKKVGCSRESVRYRIQRLERQEIITGYSLWINPAKMGYEAYKVYLKLSGTKEQRKKLRDYCYSLKNLVWLGTADGSWDVGLTLYEKDHLSYEKKKDALFKHFSEIIVQKDFGIVTEIKVFPKRFLLDKQDDPKVLLGPVSYNKIDEFDVKILNLLNNNARQKYIEMARSLGVTMDLVRNRIKRLERKGIVLQYRVNVDYTKLGYEFFKVFLYFKHYSPEDEAKLNQFCYNHFQVLNYVKQIMPWDAEIEVMAENYLQCYELINGLRDLFPGRLVNAETALMNEDSPFPKY